MTVVKCAITVTCMEKMMRMRKCIMWLRYHIAAGAMSPINDSSLLCVCVGFNALQMDFFLPFFESL